LLKIAVLISGSGSNLQAIIDSIESGELSCSLEMVISDREKAYGLERAKSKGIKTYVISKKDYGNCLSEEILKLVKDRVDLIVLAGFLSILEGEILTEFKNRIINIHPSLIPAFCGKGMYGIKVHEEALKLGVKFSGCTVHFVDEGTDSGAIIDQRVVPVYCEDTPAELQSRILTEEHKLLPQVIRHIAEDRLRLEDAKAVLFR
jgi:phosphoribosylglycinamide formyltransferase-1